MFDGLKMHTNTPVSAVLPSWIIFQNKYMSIKYTVFSQISHAFEWAAYPISSSRCYCLQGFLVSSDRPYSLISCPHSRFITVCPLSTDLHSSAWLGNWWCSIWQTVHTISVIFINLVLLFLILASSLVTSVWTLFWSYFLTYLLQKATFVANNFLCIFITNAVLHIDLIRLNLAL